MRTSDIISDINSRIPVAVSGNWRINEFEVKKDDVFKQLINSFSGRYVPVGTYKQLLYYDEVVMSNTPDEIRDHREFLDIANGDVLISGLGLGVCLVPLLKNEKINSITVIEKNIDVINLISPYYIDNKLRIIHSDIFEWKPDKKYNVVWHDIWYEICEDNVDEMKKLHRKFGRFSEWQGSWCKHECQMLKKRNWRF